MIFVTETRVVPVTIFGPVDSFQKPDRVIMIPDGWRVIGSTTLSGGSYLPLERRRLRWFSKARKAV